ncbi:MAG: hypothetical protein U9N41_02990 [Euryarchaeota archaeon]|nr:hypothetical protein [Euryarchaeota archaeon]
MSQSRSRNGSGSGVTHRGVIPIHDSMEIREGDSLLEINKRIEMIGEKIDMLSSEISELKTAFEELSRLKEFLPLNIRVVEVRETTVEGAKREILEYCDKHKGEIFYPDDVADELGLDLKTTVEATEELMKEGKVEEG